MTMDARKQRVLQAIVALYGLEGEPVGSSVLANYFDMAVSSATLRNEMAALTKLGLLEQPHTSAGRVPSAKGYRYYLDHLLTDDQPLDRVTRARVDAVFASLDHEPEKLAQGAAKALAAISGCTAAVSTPCAEDLCIAHYEVVQVGRSAAAVLAVTTAGYVRTRVMGDGCVEKSKGVAGWYKIITERNNVHFLDAEGCEFNQIDFMHLTRKGHAQLAEKLAELVPTLL